MERKRHKRSGDRLHINCFSFVFACVILITPYSLVRGHFTDRINKISDDLDRSLGAALEIRVANYTDIYKNVTYYSNNTHNPRGMAVLYNVTTKFMDLVASKDIYPEGLIKVENGRLQLGSFEEQWQSILAHYGAILAVIIVLLLFAILMPICGFFFCCCRCCGKCGARSKPFDKKGDLCKKICLASLLICVGTLLLFGVVCAFVTNQAIQDHTYELSPTLRNGIKDTETYLKYIRWQVNVLLNINYKEFEKHLFTTLNACSDILLKQLEEYSKAASLTEVVDIVNSLEYINGNLTFLEESTKIIRTNASQLNDGLRKVRKDLLVILNQCDGIVECAEIANKHVNELATDIHFDGLPDISTELANLKKIIKKNIKEVVHEGEKALENIKSQINGTVSQQIPQVQETIGNVGRDIVNHGANVSSVITKAIDTISDHVNQPLAEMDKYINEYTLYRYYLGIAISCVLLLITLCITLGLICGICGKRPDAYGDDCCNKGAGSRFLMFGVAVMFIFVIALAVVAVVYFFTGILAQRLACDTLRNPKNSQVLHLVDQVINFKQTIGININASSVLTSIHNNRSIYYTFELKNHFDLENVQQYMEKFEIKKTLENLIKDIEANTENIVLINPKAEEYLDELINSGIDNINYDKFIAEYQGNLTTVDLSVLSEQLDHLVAIVNSKYPRRNDISTSLMLSALHLRTYQDNLVVPMINRSTHVINSAKVLQNSFNSEIVTNLIGEIKAAEQYLRVNGTSDLLKIATNFANGLEMQVHSYLDRVVLHVKDDLGVSGPISRVINATLIGTCDKILLPWNGFWFSILWCLMLFIPAIILSVKLAGLYQKYEAYPGPLVEAEYLYDAYAERDNIPLSSSQSDKRHKKKKKLKRRDGRGAYVAEPPNDHGVAREVPSGSARYADMAPKHWEEFPAGGPPHYQRAPTEYERPPPYYYPENSNSK